MDDPIAPGADRGAAVDGVLFDFHWTLFDVDDDERWVSHAARMGRIPMTPATARRIAERMQRARSLPGGIDQVIGRDLSERAHRRAMSDWLDLAAVPPPLARALCLRLTDPRAWHPYPETASVLRSLVARGVPIGVLSNVGWDIRPVFARYGLNHLITAFVLSYELGVEKPAPAIFRAGCARLGTAPARTVMVGDNPVTDGGCVEAGLIGYILPPPKPDTARGLAPILSLAGVRTPPDPHEL